MTSDKHEFEATEGLLADVMKKQAGSIEKAILEGVMNSVDAGAKNIEVGISSREVTITDDGSGMSRSEIERYFQKFGLKDDDISEKEFGKFRMGRGQMFNFGTNIWVTGEHALVVNIHDDETEVTLGGERYTLDTSGLSYHIIEYENDVEGCEVTVQLDRSINDQKSGGVPDVEAGVKNLIRYIPWFHGVSVQINGQSFRSEPEDAELRGNAFISVNTTKSFGDVSVYNKGAYVKDVTEYPFSGSVISTEDLDVNFARNDILDTDDTWSSIKTSLESAAVEQMVDKSDLTTRQRVWLLNQAKGDDHLLGQISDKPLFEDVNGDEWSLNHLAGKPISFAQKYNKRAQDLMEKSDTIVLDNSYSDVVRELVGASEFITFAEAVKDKDPYNYREVSEGDLSTRRLDNLAKIRWFLGELGYDGEIMPGYSQDVDVWKDENSTLYVDKTALKAPKDRFTTEIIFECVRIAAFDEETLTGESEDITYRRRFKVLMENYGEAQHELIHKDPDVDLFKNFV